MVRVYEADTSIDAHLLRGLLEQRGIPVHIVGEALEGGVGELPAGGLVAVLVPDDCWEAALEVVDAFEANLADPAATDDPPEGVAEDAYEPRADGGLCIPAPPVHRAPNAVDWAMLLGFLAGATALSLLADP